MTARFENARAGDEVVCTRFGKGMIEEVVKISGYPIRVRFDHDIQSYNIDGRNTAQEFTPSLFWANGYKPPVNGKEPKRLPDIPVDTKMLVWSFKDSQYRGNRHFSHWSDDSSCNCYNDGKTTWSNPSGNTTSWKYWEIVK